MAKKVISICLIIVEIVVIFSKRGDLTLDRQIENFYQEVSADAACVLLYDIDASETVFSKNTEAKISVGSIIKLLSLLVADKYFKRDEVIYVGNEVDYNVAEDASRSMIRHDQKLTYEQLVTAILLPSGCDATMTLAVNTARRMTKNDKLSAPKCINVFCKAMNEYAASLGCKNSYFVNPDGQDSDKQYTNVSDVFLIVKDVMKNDLIMEISDKCFSEEKFITGEVYSWVNTNRLINPDDELYYEYAHGLKTGSTTAGGYSLVSFAEKDGHRILGIVCGCAPGNSRFRVMTNLFKICFAEDQIK